MKGKALNFGGGLAVKKKFEEVFFLINLKKEVHKLVRNNTKATVNNYVRYEIVSKMAGFPRSASSTPRILVSNL